MPNIAMINLKELKENSFPPKPGQLRILSDKDKLPSLIMFTENNRYGKFILEGDTSPFIKLFNNIN